MKKVNMRHKHFSRGITLVEMLVVMAVLSILAAIAIPTFASLGQFVATDVQSTTRTLYSSLRAARIYASTFHVDTAIVYSLDNYGPEGEVVTTPVVDNVAGEQVRVINAIAMAFKCPVRDKWVPVPTEDGAFTRFPGDAVILLRSPGDMRLTVNGTPRTVLLMDPLYTDANRRFDRDAGALMMAVFGMSPIALDLSVPPHCGTDADPAQTVDFAAHIFTPRGSLEPSGTKQRFEMLVAASPEETTSERLVDPELNALVNSSNQSNLLTTSIELFQATGRIRVVS